jgi:hypothetical protein
VQLQQVLRLEQELQEQLALLVLHLRHRLVQDALRLELLNQLEHRLQGEFRQQVMGSRYRPYLLILQGELHRLQLNRQRS